MKPRVSFVNSLKEYQTWLKLAYDGKSLWETSGTNVPGMLTVPSGENAESVLRKATAQPRYEFYDNVVLPECLQEPSGAGGPGGGQTLGNSRVTPTGLH